MAKRQAIKPSLRWSVFYRDGFACRYCGAQAGEDGIEIVVDHMLSVAEGGDNRFDNLITACKHCNGGKGATSIRNVPTSDEVAHRIRERRENVEALQSELAESMRIQADLEQQIVNLKCSAYQTESVRMGQGEATTAINLLKEFGSDKLVEWYSSASQHGVRERDAIRYVCGCARNTRAEQ